MPPTPSFASLQYGLPYTIGSLAGHNNSSHCMQTNGTNITVNYGSKINVSITGNCD